MKPQTLFFRSFHQYFEKIALTGGGHFRRISGTGRHAGVGGDLPRFSRALDLIVEKGTACLCFEQDPVFRRDDRTVLKVYPAFAVNADCGAVLRIPSFDPAFGQMSRPALRRRDPAELSLDLAFFEPAVSLCSAAYRIHA